MWQLITLFVTHFFADFILQGRTMAQKKSSHLGWLTLHLLIQFFAFWAVTRSWQFALVNALIHGAIDWNIWRLYKTSVYFRANRMDPRRVPTADFKYWEDSMFYWFIGLDQMLHGITLIVLAYTLL